MENYTHIFDVLPVISAGVECDSRIRQVRIRLYVSAIDIEGFNITDANLLANSDIKAHHLATDIP